jgi:hypothetical protein
MLLHAAGAASETCRSPVSESRMSTGETGRTRRQISVEASGSWT